MQNFHENLHLCVTGTKENKFYTESYKVGLQSTPFQTPEHNLLTELK
jgi:hypothetical protein